MFLTFFLIFPDVYYIGVAVDQTKSSSRPAIIRQFVARYNYDPFTMSPNDDPESELPLRAGERVTVIGDVDSVSRRHFYLLSTFLIRITTHRNLLYNIGFIL